MRRAFVAARKGLGNTQPNPPVGAIVLDFNGKKVGEGFHPKAGEPHAEVFALDQAGEHARGGTIYVTLEPCIHFGRTPPCTERVLASGVRRVVFSVRDPNSVSGGGAEILRDKGLEVSWGCLSDWGARLIEPFTTRITKKRPLVTAKAALSLDGNIGAAGARVFLSGPACEKTTMRLRAEAGAILVGVNTVLSDDPKLTVRGKHSHRTTIRAVIDPNLRTPPSARIFAEAGGPVWILCHKRALTSPKAEPLRQRGAVLKPIVTEHERFTAEQILSVFENGFTALLVEGGATLFSTFASSHLVDRWVLYLTPHVLGNAWQGKPTISLLTSGDFRLRFRSVIRRGDDWEIVAVQE